ncbi:unnamed protein product [Orchesella dallaii]|uniref:Ig-like domain-containing protein n=1 Tax=Orchesella dallaii TaxID=48710 RepID=A0ABP1QMZ5_9HEXA
MRLNLPWAKNISFIFFLFFTSYSEVFINGSFSKNLSSPEVELDLICIKTNPIKCLNKPELDKNSYLSNLFSNNSIFLTEDELVASFECNASYPVEWVYSQEEWLTALVGNNWLTLLKTRITKFTRMASDIHDPSTFRYSAVLIVTHVIGEFQHAVGQYKCRSIADPTDEATIKAISVFSEGNIYAKAFALSRKNVTIWIGGTEDNPVIFPCHVINPSAAENVKLFIKVFRKPLRLPPRKLNFTRIKRPPRIFSNKTALVQSMETWVEIRPNSNIRFVAELGWVYNKTVDKFTKFPNSLKLSPGSYKCTMNEEDDDWVGIQLENGKKPKPPQFDEPIVSNATVTYSRDTNQNLLRIKCCSSTANPPKLYTMDCYNRFTCEQEKKYFAHLDSRQEVYKGVKRTTGSCMESLSVSYTFFIPINVRCTGDGINYSKTVYIPLVDRNMTYTSWEAVDPYKMVEIYPKDWDWRTKGTLSSYKRSFTHYEGETTNFQCVIVSSYFSIGSKVEIEFANGSTIPATEGAGHHDLIKRAFGVYTLNIAVTMRKDFKSLSCYAPVLNSDRWIKKTVKLNVIGGHPPNIRGTSERQDVFWTLNDTMKTLECEFSGTPMPTTVEWKKDNIIIQTSTLNNRYNVSILHGNTSVLLVNVATYETHGVYTCTAKNIVGSATNTFQVYIRASETYWTIASASLGILCLMSVLVFLIFQTWKQRKNLDTTRSKG